MSVDDVERPAEPNMVSFGLGCLTTTAAAGILAATGHLPTGALYLAGPLGAGAGLWALSRGWYGDERGEPQ